MKTRVIIGALMWNMIGSMAAVVISGCFLPPNTLIPFWMRMYLALSGVAFITSVMYGAREGWKSEWEELKRLRNELKKQNQKARYRAASIEARRRAVASTEKAQNNKRIKQNTTSPNC